MLAFAIIDDAAADTYFATVSSLIRHFFFFRCLIIDVIIFADIFFDAAVSLMLIFPFAMFFATLLRH